MSRLTLVCGLVLTALAGQEPAKAQAPLDLVAEMEGKGNRERIGVVAASLEAFGLEVNSQTFSHEKGGQTLEGKNLLVEVEGSENLAGRIVVGAHLDAAPLEGGGLSRGAVDNAAGTSIVVHLALRLVEQKDLRHDFHLVFFDMEELGFVGSRHYVEGLAPGEVRAMVNVDIATTGETIIFGPKSAPGNAELYQINERLCAERQTSCLDFPNYPPSDECSFQPAGIANISFAIVPQVEAHQLWLRLNGGKESGLAGGFVPRTATLIHTPDDRLEEVDGQTLTILLDHLEAYLLELDARLAPNQSQESSEP